MKNRGKGFLFLGLFLIAAAFSLTAYNLYDQKRAEQTAFEAVQELEEYLKSSAKGDAAGENQGEKTVTDQEKMAVPDYVLFPEMEMPTEQINGMEYIGILRISVLQVELPVISEWSYPHLKKAPCRYSGSAYQDNLILCAHNYASHFGKLKFLQTGDIVSFTDLDGNEFVYEVAELEILSPTSTEEMETGDWDLTLFTCTLGGQSRVTVRCEKIREERGKNWKFVVFCLTTDTVHLMILRV